MVSLLFVSRSSHGVKGSTISLEIPQSDGQGKGRDATSDRKILQWRKDLTLRTKDNSFMCSHFVIIFVAPQTWQWIAIKMIIDATKRQVETTRIKEEIASSIKDDLRRALEVLPYLSSQH